MAEVFKCGDIANIINSNKSQIKPKKRSKSLTKFKNIIKENKNKVIEINKKQDFSVKKTSIDSEDDDQQMSETEDLDSTTSKGQDLAEKNERTVFVGNLPNAITPKILRNMFKKCGKIESLRLRGAVPEKEKMSKKVAVITKSFHSGRDNINAYVVFKSKDDVSTALQLNGIQVEGHHIRVDRAVNDSSHDNSRSVFVGNLPFIVKEEELHEFFEDCGPIESVRVVRDSTTGVGKGFGFILFNSKDSVVLALEKNEKQLLGRELRVTRAKGKKGSIEPKLRHKKRTNNSDETETLKITNKKIKKSGFKPEFEGISAKKIKKKSNKKKEFQSMKTKKKQKKLAQIFSH